MTWRYVRHVSLFKATAFECKGSTISERRVKALPHQVSRYRTARQMLLMLATFPLDFFCQGVWHQRKASKTYKIAWPSVDWHLLKRTLLDCSSAFGAFAWKVRPHLGHHRAGFRSELTYSSDEMSRLQAKMYWMIFAGLVNFAEEFLWDVRWSSGFFFWSKLDLGEKSRNRAPFVLRAPKSYWST